MNQPGAYSRGHVLRACLVFAFTLLVTAGCTQPVRRSQGGVAVAPMLSVERFLQASNARDYDAMARLFGTSNGPISDTGGTFGCAFKKMGSWMGLGSRCVRFEEVELRMATIAEVLRHQDYKIASERIEPGRSTTTNRVGVDLTRQGEVIRDVPFLVVRTASGSWLIQEIELQKLTGR